MAQIKVTIPEESKFGSKIKIKAKLGERKDQVLGAPLPKKRTKRTNSQDGTTRS